MNIIVATPDQSNKEYSFNRNPVMIPATEAGIDKNNPPKIVFMVSHFSGNLSSSLSTKNQLLKLSGAKINPLSLSVRISNDAIFSGGKYLKNETVIYTSLSSLSCPSNIGIMMSTC
jgi:hypothetical protein